MVFEVVECLDPTGDVMVARIPEQGSGEFMSGSQLVVQDNQIACFYRDGRMADQFRGGRYTLTTNNLPVLRGLTKMVFKGKTPFRAYVYFVNLKTFTDMGWGTPQPILFRDSELKMVNLRAHGTFSVRIADHVKFLNTLVGTQGIKDTAGVEEYIRKIVVSRFASSLPQVLTTVIDLAAQYQNIEVKVKAAARNDLGQYGLELVDLIVQAVTMPPEVQKIVDQGAGIRTVGADEVARYQQIAAADALKRAAETGGGGELTGGLGIGAGLAMGSQFASNIAGANRQQQQGAQAGPPPIPQGSPWYVALEGRQVGPLSLNDLTARIRDGKVTKETLVWKEGMADWTPAGDVGEIGKIFGAGPPPLPKQP